MKKNKNESYSFRLMGATKERVKEFRNLQKGTSILLASENCRNIVLEY